jgi:geranylgeranyl diphosphate synthase type II
MDFKAELEKRIIEAESFIRRYLPKEEGQTASIAEAMNYSVLGGGKRLRPVMLLEMYHICGGLDPEVVGPCAAAIEMIHSYSLVHDDLPAMDNDEYRRGRKSTHAMYGEAMGILAGDGLLNYAYETALLSLEKQCTPATARALRILAVKAGIYGMVGGQVVDVASEGKQIPMETLEYIHENKTGAMIESALMTGAALAGASDEVLALAEQIGSDVGIAFQIRDDILDVTGDSAVLGKQVGSDEKNEKVTYVTLAGMEGAKAKVEELSQRAMENVRKLPGDNAFMAELIASLINREK